MTLSAELRRLTLDVILRVTFGLRATTSSTTPSSSGGGDDDRDDGEDDRDRDSGVSYARADELSATIGAYLERIVATANEVALTTIPRNGSQSQDRSRSQSNSHSHRNRNGHNNSNNSCNHTAVTRRGATVRRSLAREERAERGARVPFPVRTKRAVRRASPSTRAVRLDASRHISRTTPPRTPPPAPPPRRRPSRPTAAPAATGAPPPPEPGTTASPPREIPPLFNAM